MTAGNPHPAIRRARTEEAEALAVLDGLVNPSPWTPAQFLGACTEGASPEIALVLEEGGQLVGFVVYSRILDDGSIHALALKTRAPEAT